MTGAPDPLRPADDAALVAAAQGDAALLAAWRARAAAGEPIPYVVGFIEFRGRRFEMDRRAFITDPELSFLVDLVIQHGDHWEEAWGRPPQVVEFGTGAGTLLLSVVLERPHWRCAGLDVDADALALAASNGQAHGVSVEWIHSDYFSAWESGRTEPDIVFGDPPWGTASDLYDEGRDAAYYLRMPRHSAFPLSGGRTGIHDKLIREWVRLGWRGTLLLNYGMLPEDVIARSAAPLRQWSLLHPQPGLSVLKASNGRADRPRGGSRGD